MKDNVLKKDFQEKDVQRLRNLIQGKQGEKTRSSVGFSKADTFYKEGDVWESDGRTWTIKDGIKQNITKLDKAKKAHNMPLFCPCCGKVMKKRNDKPFYRIHKKCFDCVIDMEVQLRKEGKWEEYERNIKNNEIDNRIKEFKIYIEERLKESNDSFVSESGEVEKWVGKVNKDKVEEYVKEAVEYLESLKT
tara:strand:+ start:355 stop:927 length:573 start_codon:yes stop_codon:yes gene_type:complete